MEIKLSQGEMLQCPQCGQIIVAFRATHEIGHQPPECSWFRRMVEPECIERRHAVIRDDVSN